jgi:hypothetical protein
MANTSSGAPYPTGTDKVIDGDNAIRALAETLDKGPSAGTGKWVGAGATIQSGWAIVAQYPLQYRRWQGWVEFSGALFRTAWDGSQVNILASTDFAPSNMNTAIIGAVIIPVQLGTSGSHMANRSGSLSVTSTGLVVASAAATPTGAQMMNFDSVRWRVA